MKAVCWYGTEDIRVERVPDPEILNPGDAILRVTSTAICGSDLHMYDGTVVGMEKGDIVGHEFMGEVVEVGRGVKKLKKGDRVVVPFNIACGSCFFCDKKLWSLCDNSNPNAYASEKVFGQRTCGLFGYSKLFGAYAGGQAEYVRVPYADVGPVKVPDAMSQSSLFLLFSVSRRWFVTEDGNFDHREWGLDVSLSTIDLVEVAPVIHLFLFCDESRRRYAELGCRGQMPVSAFIDRALSQDLATAAAEKGICVPASVTEAFPSVASELAARSIPVFLPPPGFRSVVIAVREWEADIMWPLVEFSFAEAVPRVPKAAAAANRALEKRRDGRVPHVSLAIAHELRHRMN